LSRSTPWHTFDVEYDYLVTAVGAIPNTFGVPGVAENCMFFKAGARYKLSAVDPQREGRPHALRVGELRLPRLDVAPGFNP
jgi:hypothetical protein